jgi:hypothetical protein
LTARTVFLERLGVEVKGPVGPVLWWQGAALGAGMLAIAYYVVGGVVSIGQQAAAAIIGLLKMVYPELPIAEQITLELLLWSVPAAIVSLVLLVVWLKLFGWRIRRFVVTYGTASSASYQERVHRWDDSRIPPDPALVLGSLGGVAVVLTVLFWLFLPVTTPHPHENYPQPEARTPHKSVKPEEVLKQTETTLAQAEAILQALEEDKGKDLKKAEQKGK